MRGQIQQSTAIGFEQSTFLYSCLGEYLTKSQYWMQIIMEESDTMNIDAMNIYESDEELYRQMVRYPLEVLAILDAQIRKMEAPIVEELNPSFENYIQVFFPLLICTFCRMHLNSNTLYSRMSKCWLDLDLFFCCMALTFNCFAVRVCTFAPVSIF
jgi:DNA replicative helicase MCM subunit Mcm2 (Cdc46/Mcm family)